MSAGIRRIALLLVVMSAALSAAETVPLIEAVKRGDREAARTLLRDKSTVNTAEADGPTARDYACDAIMAC